jgi:branched-chain amino acid transport system ATP-binding protein
MSSVFFGVEKLLVMFGGLCALNGLDLEIREGEIIGLIGPNGAGKTTAFNAITGRIRPTSGRIVFGGDDITGWSSPRIAQRGIARTFQSIKLYDDLTVVENVMVAGHSSIRYSFIETMINVGRYARDEKRIRNHAHELLELMGLADMAYDKAQSLPYGSQRKLEVARALALHPRLLLLDEPVAGMNPLETMEFSKLLRKIHSQKSIAIGLIDHDMKFVMNVCDRIKVIDHGVPIAWGTPHEIRNDERVIAAYLGKN